MTTVNAVELHLQFGSHMISVGSVPPRSFPRQMNISQRATTDSRADVLGIACSAGCAVHCAAMPVVASAAPMLGLGWMAGSVVHQIVAALCCFFVIKAIVPGWRWHRDPLVAICVGSGLSLLLLAAFILPDPCCEPSSIFGGWIGFPVLSVGQLQAWTGMAFTQNVLLIQPYLTPVGGVLLIAAHVMNLDLMRRHSHRACQPSGCLPSSGC